MSKITAQPTKTLPIILLAIGLIISAILVISLVTSPEKDEQILIKFAHVTTAQTPKGKGALLFQKLVSERLNGKVRVEIFGDGQLYDERAVIKALILNDVQFAAPSLSKFDKYTKQWALFDLPFLFKDEGAFGCFSRSDEGQKLLHALDKKGVVGLNYWPNGMKQISANRPLITPEDVRGLKFRIMSSDMLQAQFEALGANPQKMAFVEAYNAMATKVVDGQENTWSNILAKKFFEVQSDFTRSNHGILGYAVITNQEFWGKLPADIRAELTKIIDEVTQAVTKIARDDAIEDLATIQALNITNIHSLTAAQKQLWIDAMQPVWTKFEAQIGKNNIAAVQRCNAKTQ